MRCIFIGGKELGYKALNILLNHKIKPLLVIGNMDDNGKHNIAIMISDGCGHILNKGTYKFNKQGYKFLITCKSQKRF